MRIVSCSSVTGVSSAADRSITFQENMISVSGSPVRELILSGIGTGFTVAAITTITVKAGGVPFIDAPPSFLRAHQNFMAKGTCFAEADASFNVVFPGPVMMGQSFPQNVYTMGAPPGQLLRVEILKTTTPAATVATLHELVIEEPAMAANAWPYFIAIPMNIAASQTSAPFQINTPGILVGLVLEDSADITALRYYGASGLVYDFSTALALRQAFRNFQGADAVSDVMYLPVPPEPVVPGRTRIEITTAAGWVGVTGRLGVHTIVPIAPPQ